MSESEMLESLRASGGRYTDGPLSGVALLILTTQGAKSGLPRESIVRYTRDGADYVVAASKGGSPTHPFWYSNLLANPHVTVEVEGRILDARASVASGVDRDNLWRRHVEANPPFGEYPKMTDRIIPMIRLSPMGH